MRTSKGYTDELEKLTRGGSDVSLTVKLKAATAKRLTLQLYFYKNLLDPEKNSKILQHEKLTKKTIDILLNEIFTLDQNENERRVREFSKQAYI